MARGLTQTLVLGILKHLNMMYLNMNKIHYIYRQGLTQTLARGLTQTLVLGILKHLNMMYFNMNKIIHVCRLFNIIKLLFFSSPGCKSQKGVFFAL